MADTTNADTTVRIRIRRVLGQYEFLESEAEHIIPKGAPIAAVGEVREWLATQLDPELANAAAKPEERPVDERVHAPHILTDMWAKYEELRDAEAAAEPETAEQEADPGLDDLAGQCMGDEPEPELTPDEMRERIREMIPKLSRSMGAQPFLDRYRAVLEEFGVVPGQRIPDEHLSEALAKLEALDASG